MIMSSCASVAIILAAALILYALIRVAIIRYQHEKFKIKSKGLPMHSLPLLHPGGNVHEFGFSPYALLRLEALHRKYGKTFGCMMSNQETVVSVDLELIRLIIGGEANKHTHRANLAIPVREFGTNGFWFNQTDRWRAMRRPFAPSLAKHKLQSKNIVEGLDSVIRNLVGCMESHLKASPDGSSAIVNVSDVIMRYSTDLINDCFYKQHNTIYYGLDKEDPFVAALELGINDSLSPITEFVLSFPLFIPLFDKLFEYFHPLGVMKLKVIGFIKQQAVLSVRARREIEMAKRKGLSVDLDNVTLSDGQMYKRNMIDSFIDSFHEGRLNEKEFVHSTFFLYFAAIKTVSDAIVRMIYYMATNADVQEKLRASILKDGFESEYLGWCINEVLRLEPPVPSSCSRRLGRDVEVEGGVVPEGTHVLVSAYTIHRLPEYWGKDANQFRPERWADAHKFHPAQFIPFGGGLRICPGREFALLDIRKVMEALLTRYKIERCSKTSDATLFNSPMMVTLVFDVPTYVKLSRLSPPCNAT